MQKIAVLSSKGGTGKTTTSINLAHGLALQGKKVLLIDSDPQDTIGVVFDVSPQYSLCDLLLTKKTSIVKVRENFHLITSGGIDLANTEIKLSSKFKKEYKLKNHLAKLDNFDYVICDCAPSVNLINTNVLTFCSKVIIPVAMDFLSQIGANQVLSIIESVKNKFNPNLEIFGVLPVFYNENRKISVETVGILRDFFKNKLFDCLIHDDENLKESPSFMKTIFEYSPDSVGAKDYSVLAKEVIERVEKNG